MFKLFLSALAMATIPLAAHADPESYCSGPSCGDATAAAGATQTADIPPIPVTFIFRFWLTLMMDDYAEQYPDNVVSSRSFPSDAVMEVDLNDIANLVLFYDPLTYNLGLSRSDFVAGLENPGQDPQMPEHIVDPNQEPFDFRFMTTGDYVGHLEFMLDNLIERYPDHTVPAGTLTSSEPIYLSMSQVANFLIFLDPYLDNLGWSPSVFE